MEPQAIPRTQSRRKQRLKLCTTCQKLCKNIAQHASAIEIQRISQDVIV